MSLLKSNPDIGVVYTDAEYFGEKNGRWHVPEFDLLSLVRMNFIDACALYRKKLWEELGGYDEHAVCVGLKDWDFWLRVAGTVRRLLDSEDPSTYRRNHKLYFR